MNAIRPFDVASDSRTLSPKPAILMRPLTVPVVSDSSVPKRASKVPSRVGDRRMSYSVRTTAGRESIAMSLLTVPPATTKLKDRKSVVSGKRVPVRVDLDGRRIIKKKTYQLQ